MTSERYRLATNMVMTGGGEDDNKGYIGGGFPPIYECTKTAMKKRELGKTKELSIKDILLKKQGRSIIDNLLIKMGNEPV